MEQLDEDTDPLADNFEAGCAIGFWCGAFTAAVIVALFRGFAT